MNRVIFVTVFIVVGLCVKGQNEIIAEILNKNQKSMEKFLGSFTDPEKHNELQLRFIEKFVRRIVLSEIRMQELAFDNTKVSVQDAQKLHDQLDGLVAILFEQKYPTIQQLIGEIKKKNPNSLENIFAENTFKTDIKKKENQERLATAITQFIFNGGTSSENLDIGLKKIELIKVFLIQYKGVQSQEIDENLAYLTDDNKMRKSISTLITKLQDPSIRGKFFKLALKFQTQKTDPNGSIISQFHSISPIISFKVDFLSLLLEDSELMGTVGDVDWNSLLSLEQKLLMFKGKRLDEYYQDSNELFKDHENINVNDEEDNEDGSEDPNDEGSSPIKTLLIIASVFLFLGAVFTGVRKYRQDKQNEDTLRGKRKQYRPQL